MDFSLTGMGLCYRFNPAYFNMRAGVNLNWWNTAFTAYDVGIAPFGAGTLEVNSGTLHDYRDIAARTISITGLLNAAGISLTGGMTFNRAFAQDGSAAAPTYTFSNENTTGFYRAGAGSVGLAGTFFAGDITTTRGPGHTTGAYYMGGANGGGRYLYYDGSSYIFSVGQVVAPGVLSVGNNGVSGIGSAFLDVKSAAGFHTCVIQGPAYGALVQFNDGGGAFKAMHLGGGVKVVPYADNATDLGEQTYRWKQIYAFNTTISSSDARNKTDVQTSPLGLDFINSLRPVAYRWIVGENLLTREPDGEEEVPETWDIDGTHHPATTRPIYKDVVTPVEGKRTHYGLIAQEVAQSLVTANVGDFAGYVQLDMTKEDSELGLRYSEFIAPLIKAVQELSAKVNALEAQLAARK
jgi:hypothetical protein